MYYNVYLTGTNYLVCFCLLMEKAQIYVIILHCLLTNLFKAYYAKKYCFMRNSVCFNVETSQRPMVSRSYQHSVDTALGTNFTHRRKSFTFVSFLIIIFLVHQNIYSYIFILSFLYASLFYITDCLNDFFGDLVAGYKGATLQKKYAGYVYVFSCNASFISHMNHQTSILLLNVLYCGCM